MKHLSLWKFADGRLQFELPLAVTDEEIAYIKGPVSSACCGTHKVLASSFFRALVGWSSQSLRRQTPTDGRCPPSLIVQSSVRQIHPHESVGGHHYEGRGD